MNICRDNIPIEFQAKILFAFIFHAHCCENGQKNNKILFNFQIQFGFFFVYSQSNIDKVMLSFCCQQHIIFLLFPLFFSRFFASRFSWFGLVIFERTADVSVSSVYSNTSHYSNRAQKFQQHCCCMAIHVKSDQKFYVLRTQRNSKFDFVFAHIRSAMSRSIKQTSNCVTWHSFHSNTGILIALLNFGAL